MRNTEKKGDAIDRSVAGEVESGTINNRTTQPSNDLSRDSPTPRPSTNALVSPSPEPPEPKVEDDSDTERRPTDLSSPEPDKHLFQIKSWPAPNAIGDAATAWKAQVNRPTPNVAAFKTATSSK